MVGRGAKTWRKRGQNRVTRGHERGQQTTAGHHCHLCPLRLRRWTVSHTVRGAGSHVPRDADAGFSPEEHECHCLSCRPPTKVSLVPLRGVHGWRHCWCGSAACTEVSAGRTDTRRPLPLSPSCPPCPPSLYSIPATSVCPTPPHSPSGPGAGDGGGARTERRVATAPGTT